MPSEPRIVALEWFLVFSNNGSVSTPPVCAIYGVNASFIDNAGVRGNTLVRRYLGSAGSTTDYNAINETLATGSSSKNYTSFFPQYGRSSDGTALPLFTAFNSGGAGFTFSVGWSGSWTAALRRGDANGSGNRTNVWIRHDTQNGACPGVCTTIYPGESFRSMRVLMVSFPSDGPESYHLGVNAHRRLLARFKVPRGLDGNVLGALTSALGWWGYPNCPNMTVGSAMSLLDAVKASAAVQAYWLDASWFNGCFPNGVGCVLAPPPSAHR